MEKGFWETRWSNNEIGFHLPRPHPLLVRYLPALELASNSRVFVPLCGKSLDIPFLLDQGLQVIGAELSDIAVQALFEHCQQVPEIAPWAGGKRYRAGALTVYQGDIFALTAHILGTVDASYDRAALIALPETMRRRYARHLVTLTNKAPQLLITLAYEQQQMPGPPFSVSAQQVAEYYQAHYELDPLSSKEILDHEPRFRDRGLTSLQESSWRLRPKP